MVEGIVRKAKSEALAIVTLYSPFMFATQMTSRETVKAHLETDPEPVKRGIETIAAGVLEFVEGCIQAGVDGFYASTQGGETGYLANRKLFDEYVKPSDLAVWEVIGSAWPFNILHVCDYHGPYLDLAAYREYPGTVVNAPLQISRGSMNPKEIAELFGRPFMGGMDRHGVLATGPTAAIRKEAEAILADRPERFILGADCTVPSGTPWDNLKAAIDAAHGAPGLR